MNKLLRRGVAFLVGVMLWLTVGAQAVSVDRVDPPHWWVGMREPSLQLMLYGKGIGQLQARLSHPGVRLTRTVRGDSPNVLFLQLHIAPGTRAGALDIVLLERGQRVATLRYPLLARKPGSAQRLGFGSRDAIYLLVPDRFAQTGPGLGLRCQADGTSPDRAVDCVDRQLPNARHGGNLAGMREHLGYIADMGFTQIWPTPLTANAQPSYSYHGYAPTDLYRIDPRFGSNEDYLAFVREARALGVGVIQDIILNHIGHQHHWMSDLPTKDWIHHPEAMRNPARYVETNNAHISIQDPYAAPSDRAGFVDGWFDRTMPDLNTAQPLLAQYLIQNSIWWVEAADLSGIREDTFSYADKAFVAQWSGRLMREYPNFNLVGEEMSDQAAMVAYWQRPGGGVRNRDGYATHMPSMMDFPLVDLLRRALTVPEGHQRGLYSLYQGLGMDFVYPDPQRLMLFDGNHDMVRLGAAVGGDVDLMRMALGFVATAPRIPQFFYGTELGLVGPSERDDGRLRQDFPGGWASDASNGFSGVGLTPQSSALQAWLRRLLQWRKGSRLIHDGQTMQYMPQDGVYVYFRYLAGKPERVMVVLNKNSAATQLPMARFSDLLGGRRYRARDVVTHTEQALEATLTVPPRSTIVLELVPESQKK